jgi:hypothetical protein
MRLIDADRLKAEIMGWCVVTDDLFGMGKYYEREIVLQAIEEAPTIDAVPVVRGEWVDLNRNYSLFVMCGACKGPHFQKSKYCPNCGAKMEDKL